MTGEKFDIVFDGAPLQITKFVVQGFDVYAFYMKEQPRRLTKAKTREKHLFWTFLPAHKGNEKLAQQIGALIEKLGK